MEVIRSTLSLFRPSCRFVRIEKSKKEEQVQKCTIYAAAQVAETDGGREYDFLLVYMMIRENRCV